MIWEHNKEEKISIKEFISKIELFKNNIETTAHTFFRLSEKQRKIYNDSMLKDFLLNKKPLEIWKQKNDNLAVFYDFEKKAILKIILRFSFERIYIVTFYILNKKQVEEFKNG